MRDDCADRARGEDGHTVRNASRTDIGGSRATGARSPSRSRGLIWSTAPNAVVEPIHPKAMPVILTTDEDDVLDRLSHRPGRVNDTLQMPNISFGYP